MENDYSTSGMLEDLIRSMVQLSLLELHAKTALEISDYELSVATDSELEKAINVNQKCEEHLQSITRQRRTVLKIIQSYGKEGNPKKWCEVKHASMAMYTLFEAYQASNDVDIYNAYIEANNLFIEIMSDFLGLDIPPCSACFSDILKGEM